MFFTPWSVYWKTTIGLGFPLDFPGGLVNFPRNLHGMVIKEATFFHPFKVQNKWGGFPFISQGPYLYRERFLGPFLWLGQGEDAFLGRRQISPRKGL